MNQKRRPIAGLKPAVARKILAGFHEAHPPGGPASLQALIGFLLLFRGNHGLAGIAALPDARPRDKFRVTAAALFRHRLLKR